jgi:hypothetical protein
MNKKFVTYNGRQVIEDWPEKIVAAQKERFYVVDGIEYPRIPYGEEGEDWGADDHPCDDCAVIKGQLHVPGCDVEHCPVCGGQVLSCDCGHEVDDEE